MTDNNQPSEEIQRWTAKRKMNLVKESFKEDVSEDDLCQKYGITRQQFRKWRDKAINAGKEALVESRKKDPKQKKIEKLEKKVGQLTILTDELKKKSNG